MSQNVAAIFYFHVVEICLNTTSWNGKMAKEKLMLSSWFLHVLCLQGWTNKFAKFINPADSLINLALVHGFRNVHPIYYLDCNKFTSGNMVSTKVGSSCVDAYWRYWMYHPIQSKIHSNVSGTLWKQLKYLTCFRMLGCWQWEDPYHFMQNGFCISGDLYITLNLVNLVDFLSWK